MLAKLSWRLLENPSGLLARILFGKYCPNESFRNVKPTASSSHGWKSLLVGRDLLNKKLGWTVGNGNTINIWSDFWLSSSSPQCPYGPATLEAKDFTVSDLFKTNTTEWDKEKISRILPQYAEKILIIKPSRSEYRIE